MEHIAEQVDWEGDVHPWARCFRLCGEDGILPRLHAAPLAHKGAISGWGNVGPCGSSRCSLNLAGVAASSGDPVTAVPGATSIADSAGSHATGSDTGDVQKHLLDRLAQQAGSGSLAGLLLEAAAIQPTCDVATAASSSSDVFMGTVGPCPQRRRLASNLRVRFTRTKLTKNLRYI